jgi:uncharacterized membrane protein YraQ (UPF0718 family)
MDVFYPFEVFANWLTYSVFSLPKDSALGSTVQFFLYDTPKVLSLLLVIIYIVSLLRTYLPPEKVRDILSHKKTFVGNILASLLGIITPFCTCSAIPLFLGFIEAGVPLGVTFSFLVASPMINEVAIVLLLGMFGWKVTLIYIGSGLIIAILAGMLIGKMNLESLLEKWVLEKHQNKINAVQKYSWKERNQFAFSYLKEVLGKVWLFIVIGIGIGAWMHGYVPSDFLAQVAGKDNFLAVPIATLIGIPLYSNAAGVIPLVQVLTEKGVAMGTVLAFMMAVTALSLPEFLILKQVMKIKLILIFAGIVGVGIMFTGYLFNIIL